MTDINEIKDRIKKLLAKAEGTDNPHEQDAFMRKVEQLLEEYQIEMFEIRSHNLDVDNDPMGQQEGEFNIYASMMWAKLVIHQIARYYGARTIWESKKKNHLPYRVFGRESSRVTTEMMIPYIVSQVRQQARHYANDHGRTASVAQREIGTALSMRIQRMLNELEEHRAELQSKALVPVDTTQSYMEDFYSGKLRTTKGSQKGYGRHAADYADKISLNLQTGSSSSGRKRITG